MRTKVQYLIFSLFISLIFFNSVPAQVSLGVDIYSRYNWRGLDFGDAPSFQPSFTFTEGNFSIGAWGAYNFFGGNGTNYSENDLVASYSIPAGSAGSFTLLYTDYFFPSAGLSYFKYNIDGSHILEGGLSYTAPGFFPVTLSAYYNVKNDPGNSDYIQASYPVQAGDVELSFFAGGTTKKSAVYATEKAGVINVGLSATKEIALTDKFSLPLHLFYIVNPYLETSNIVIGISL